MDTDTVYHDRSQLPDGAYDPECINKLGDGVSGWATRYAGATGADETGNGWGNGWEGNMWGDGDCRVYVFRMQTVRSDPVPDDLRQLVTNVVAFKHIFK